MEENEIVRKLIRESFDKVPCPPSLTKLYPDKPVTHEICLALRRNLYNSGANEFLYLLPKILEDLLDTHTGDDVETEDIEYLIFHLNPNKYAPINKAVKLKQFSVFDKKQTRAICRWLKCARTWNDLRLYREETDEAIAFWCNSN